MTRVLESTINCNDPNLLVRDDFSSANITHLFSLSTTLSATPQSQHLRHSTKLPTLVEMASKEIGMVNKLPNYLRCDVKQALFS